MEGGGGEKENFQKSQNISFQRFQNETFQFFISKVHCFEI